MRFFFDQGSYLWALYPAKKISKGKMKEHKVCPLLWFYIYLFTFFRGGWVGKHTETRVCVFKSEDNLWVSGVKLGLPDWIVYTFTCRAIFLV